VREQADGVLLTSILWGAEKACQIAGGRLSL